MVKRVYFPPRLVYNVFVMKLELYQSNSYNPYFNLAVEDWLFQNVPADTVILYLWQNQNTVVIGKSQNAWKECRVALLEEAGGHVARRTSGGGAVFHDLGNLCYTFIAGSGLYDLEKQLSVIVKAVAAVGISAHFTGRNDICTEDGRKFSGNAFRFVKDKGLMHGTLLLDTDSEKLARYLQVSPVKMTAKGVSSVRSRVVNLIELNPAITVPAMKEALVSAFADEYGAGGPLQAISLDEQDQSLSPSLPALTAHFASWAWRLGDTPAFDMEAEAKFPWGLVQLAFHTENGVIQQAHVWTDAMDGELGDTLSAALTGKMLDYSTLAFSVAAACSPEVARDVAQMIRGML